MTMPVDQPNEPHLERRAVEVREPGLSESTNAQLTDEVRDVIGADQVDVPADRPHPSTGEHVKPQRLLPLQFPLPDNFVVAQGSLALVVVGAIAALAVAIHRWWTLVLALSVLGAMTYVVVAMIIKMTSNPGRPEPGTVAAMEQEGICDPEQLFSDIIAEFTAGPDTADEPGRTTDAVDDPAQAAAEQRDATTPSGGPSRAVGPGRRTR
jgi:hypothetical protein